MFLVSNKLCESDKFQPAAALLIKLPVSQVLSKYMPMHFYCYYIYPVDINISRVKGHFFHTLQKKNYPGRREGYMPALLMPKADTSSAYLMTHN